MDRIKRIGQIFSITTLLILLTGCGLEDVALPTLIPQVDFGAGQNSGGTPELEPSLDESPRTGLEIEIPATWTPESENDLLIPLNQSTPIPANEIQADASSSAGTYIVQQGDTLAEIAIQFNVTLEALADANNITDVNHIEAGQELNIPGN